jgi:oligoribonuclease NrnB/cAMP/cGMP phosphodiesterase (DHH superfamily)
MKLCVVETNPRPLIIFHDSCMDGIASAWVAWRRYFDRADYVPMRYGQKPPCCQDRVVFVLDFCFSPEETIRIADEATRVLVFDHHKTAIDRFSDWRPRPDVELHFDLKHSGAQLTAKHFSAASRLWIVDYVEDRDLWKHALPHTHEVNALLGASCLGLEPIEAFKILDQLRGLSMKQAVAQGTGALLQLRCYARQVAAEARKTTFAGHPGIPVVNLPKPMASEVLHELTQEAPFAVGWRQEGPNIVFSLRSAGKPAFDVAKLAERYGGGGHPSAAGFTLPCNAVDMFSRLLDKESA